MTGARFELRGCDARAVLAFAGELAECDEADHLSVQVAALAPLAGAESVLVTDCRDWAEDIVLEFGDPCVYRPELLGAIERGGREHPVLVKDLVRAERGARRTSDFVSARVWRRSELFNDFYRPLEMEREMSTQLSWGPAGWSCCLALHRAGREFCERDRAVLELLAPHLRAARARVAARALLADRLASLERGVERMGNGVLVIEHGGRLVAMGPCARTLLDRWFGASSPPMPRQVADWWSAERAELNPVALELTQDERLLRVELLHGGEEDVIVLTERGNERLSGARLACRLPITRREAEVLARLAEGATSDGIAHALGISRHTVIRHVEHLYAKLDVHTRAAATRTALEAVRDDV